AAGLRFQPGADGFRRDDLRRALAEVPRLPDEERVRMGPTIVVAAAVIERDGRYFLTRRQQGVHLEGCWEFPGGKCDEHEGLAACLPREPRQELHLELPLCEHPL